MPSLKIHKQSKAQAYWRRNPGDRNRRDSLDDYVDVSPHPYSWPIDKDDEEVTVRV